MAYIWKEGLEQARGKGLWLGLCLIMFASIFIIAEARSFPAELGFEAMLLSLFDTNMYLVPLFSMFLSSFSMFQEKEMKTAVILLTKKESTWSYLLKKTFAIQAVIITAFIGTYFVLALFMKGFLAFHLSSFLHFILVMIVFLLIFNQIGIFLGTFCKTKMQLVGANILTWFLLVFLIDLIFLYFLPAITFDNLRLFSWIYFLNPMHALRFYLETNLNLFGLTHLSRLMDQFIFMAPWKFLLINAVVWPLVFYGLALFIRKAGLGTR